MSEKLIKSTEGTLTLLRTSDYNIRSIDSERERIIAEALDDAQAIRSEATAILTQAKAILGDAQLEAVSLRENACNGATEEGHQKGLTTGIEEGRLQGIEQIRQVAEEEQAALLGTVETLHHTLEQQKEIVTAHARHDLVRLAVAVAGVVCKAEVAAHQSITEANVTHAVALTTQRADIELLVNPAEMKRIQEYTPTLAGTVTRSGRVTVLADASVEMGGCIVRHDTGAIDARIATQLAEIERQLIGSANDNG